MTPLLVGVFGVSLPVAIATDLLFATITKLVGVPFHHRNGSINWGLTKRLWWGSIPGTLVGVGIVVFVVAKEQASLAGVAIGGHCWCYRIYSGATGTGARAPSV